MRARIFRKASCRRVRVCWLGRWLRVVMRDLPRGTIPLTGDGRGETTAPASARATETQSCAQKVEAAAGQPDSGLPTGPITSACGRVVRGRSGRVARAENLAREVRRREHRAKLEDTRRHFGWSERNEKYEAGRGGEGDRPSRQGGTEGLSGRRRGRRDPDNKAVPNSVLVCPGSFGRGNTGGFMSSKCCSVFFI